MDRFFFKQNESFCPSFILPKWSKCPQLKTKEPSLSPQELQALLSQPFTYLSKGNEFFAFSSKDNKWVIKFLHLSKSVRRFRVTHQKKSIQKLSLCLTSIKSAYEQLPTITNVAYAHLSPSDHLKQKILLIDKLGHSWEADLDALPFVIQRKGTPYFTHFEKLNASEKKALISDTIALFLNLYDNQLIDRDPIFSKNYGVYANKPFILDIGQLEKLDSLPTRSEYLRQMTRSLDCKLSFEDPELHPFYLSQLSD